VAALATAHPLCDLQHFIWNEAAPVAASHLPASCCVAPEQDASRPSRAGARL
jgi:hypothetical protein